MYYLTVKQPPRCKQITLEDVLNGNTSALFSTAPVMTATRTFLTENPRIREAERTNARLLTAALEKFNQEHRDLIEADKRKLYRTFYIPKKTSGLRRIDEPVEELMKALRELREILENQGHALYHTAAFAYVKNRSTVDAVKKHQANRSNWFLKTDFSDFFGNHSLSYVMRMITKIYPFCEMRSNDQENVLKPALSLCFLEDKLPQGTPISPLLTNLCMIPIDHTISNQIAGEGFIYTRYADDIIISHRIGFDPAQMCRRINQALAHFSAPFTIKDSKTHYGNRNGRNWNLGVMLNKDNQITVGWKRKQQFKAMCHNYISAKADGKPWDIEDVYRLSGIISYYMMVEKEYFQSLIAAINQKYSVNLVRMIRADIRNGVRCA